MSAPRLRIEPHGAATREGDGWRTTWRVANADAESMGVVQVVAPHARFRGEATVDRVVRPSRAMILPLVVQIDATAGTEIENAFVILLIEQSAERWRVLARLRVELDVAGAPRAGVESVTVQRVGFSGEL